MKKIVLILLLFLYYEYGLSQNLVGAKISEIKEKFLSTECTQANDFITICEIETDISGIKRVVECGDGWVLLYNIKYSKEFYSEINSLIDYYNNEFISVTPRSPQKGECSAFKEWWDVKNKDLILEWRLYLEEDGFRFTSQVIL